MILVILLPIVLWSSSNASVPYLFLRSHLQIIITDNCSSSEFHSQAFLLPTTTSQISSLLGLKSQLQYSNRFYNPLTLPPPITPTPILLFLLPSVFCLNSMFSHYNHSWSLPLNPPPFTHFTLQSWQCLRASYLYLACLLFHSHVDGAAERTGGKHTSL